MIVQNDNDRTLLRQSGAILVQALTAAVDAVEPGVETGHLNAIVEERIVDLGGRPAFKNYRGFPAALCVAVNDEVVHGIPGDRIIEEGDIVGLDVGVDYEGYFTDRAVTVMVGSVPAKTRQLIAAVEEALQHGIAAARPGNTVGDIGHAIQAVIEEEGFGLVRQLVGHGVGGAVHEDPTVPNFGTPGQGVDLVAGMVLAIEPMATLGGSMVRKGDDGHTYTTVDGSLSAHAEHTVIVGDPPEIVTE